MLNNINTACYGCFILCKSSSYPQAYPQINWAGSLSARLPFHHYDFSNMPIEVTALTANFSPQGGTGEQNTTPMTPCGYAHRGICSFTLCAKSKKVLHSYTIRTFNHLRRKNPTPSPTLSPTLPCTGCIRLDFLYSNDYTNSHVHRQVCTYV